MAYVALKPCRFAGQAFKIGEEIPAGIIQQGAAKNLLKMQVIAKRAEATSIDEIQEETQQGPVNTAKVVIHADEGDMPLELTAEGLQAVFDALNTNVEGAEKIVDAMTDGDALILLHLTDGRKTVKAAAEIRAKALNGAETEAGEQ